jgi:hypothetical protein
VAEGIAGDPSAKRRCGRRQREAQRVGGLRAGESLTACARAGRGLSGWRGLGRGTRLLAEPGLRKRGGGSLVAEKAAGGWGQGAGTRLASATGLGKRGDQSSVRAPGGVAGVFSRGKTLGSQGGLGVPCFLLASGLVSQRLRSFLLADAKGPTGSSGSKEVLAGAGFLAEGELVAGDPLAGKPIRAPRRPAVSVDAIAPVPPSSATRRLNAAYASGPPGAAWSALPTSMTFAPRAICRPLPSHPMATNARSDPSRWWVRSGSEGLRRREKKGKPGV